MINNPASQNETVERLFTVLKSLNEFYKQEVRGLVRGLIAPSEREVCFTGNYYRAFANIETLLLLKNVRDVQAIAMVSRSLFEIAVDIRLINHVSASVPKIVAYPDLEKLLSCRKIAAFRKANPEESLPDINIFQGFIDANATRIEQQWKTLWPGVRLSDITHWSALHLDQRVRFLGSPFERLYAVNYPQMSWFVHSGLTGVLNLEKATFQAFAGTAFTVAAEAYMAVLGAIIAELKLEKATEIINELLQFAKMLPFTDDDRQAQQLRRELLS